MHGSFMTRLTALVSCLVLFVASPVSAQCLEGRVATERSEGRCCWPGQSWDAEAGQCTGAPQCPEGFAGEGEQCVQLNLGGSEPSPAPPAASPQYAPAQPPQHRGPPRPQPGGTDWEPHQAARSSTETEPIIGLALAGGIIFGTTYLSAALGAAFQLGFCCNGEVGFNFIPVVGPLIFAVVEASKRFPDTVGFAMAMYGASGLAQAASLALMLAGLIVQRPREPRQRWGAELTGDGVRVYW